MGRITVFVHDSCKIKPIISPIRDTTMVNDTLIVCITPDDFIYNNPDGLVVTSICDPDSGTIIWDTLSNCFIYIPDSNFVGEDVFCYTVCDTTLVPQNCVTDSIIITVLPGIDFVDAIDDIVFVPSDSNSVVINVLGNDNFGPKPGTSSTGTAIYVTGATNGTHGTTTVNPDGTVTYSLTDTNYCGIDSFSYSIADNGNPVQFDTAMVYLYICDTPKVIANADGACQSSDTTTTIGHATTLHVLANDVIPVGATGATVTVTVSPTHGTASVNADGTIAYQPNDGYVGYDELVYELCANVMGVTYCDTAKVCIFVADTPRPVPCYYPNGFSPNGDGVNDTYGIPCNEENLKNGKTQLLVFNRWGDEVWRSIENYHNDFAGQNQQSVNLPDGTYYFIYKYVDANGKDQSVAKFLVIHRE